MSGLCCNKTPLKKKQADQGHNSLSTHVVYIKQKSETKVLTV